MKSDIDKYQNDTDYAYLNKKIITLAGRLPHIPDREILVMESCGLLSFRLGRIQAEIQVRPDDDGMNSTLLEVYAPLAAYSFGDVPSIKEFLALPNEIIYEWIRQSYEINPEHLRWAAGLIGEKEKPMDLKKKGRKRRKSASG